jgi:putative ABC transport system permease protein
MTGLIISMTLISFSASAMEKSINNVKKDLNYLPASGIEVDVKLEKKIDKETLIKWFESIDKKTGIYLENIMIFLNEYRGGSLMIVPEYYNKINKRYPLIEGNYYTESDLKNGNKVVLIGRSYIQYMYTDNDIDYIDINNSRYQVLGIIGVENEKIRELDNKIVMPITSIPKTAMDELIERKEFSFFIFGTGEYPRNQYKTIKNKIMNYDTFAVISAYDFVRQNVIHISIGEYKDMNLSLLIYLCAVINTLNVSSYWIESRKREIGIRKAFGSTNIRVVGMLFAEMFLIALCSSIISLSIQIFMKFFINQIWFFEIEITSSNVFASAIIVIISAIIAVIIPSFKVMKMEPRESIRL